MVNTYGVCEAFIANDFTDVILAELCDILNVRMAALDRWTWGPYVLLEQRRKINGGFSIHFDLDLLQAIFLHFIGVKWSVFFESAFLDMHKHVAWKRNFTEISKTEKLRREYFLGDRGIQIHSFVERKRESIHRNKYFAHQLLDYDPQQIEAGEGEEEAEYKDYVASKQESESMEDDEEFEDDSDSYSAGDEEYRRQPKKPIQAKQSLLHLVSTEIVLNTRLHGQLYCLHTTFDSWNPLLPHQTIYTVLDVFGVSEKWQNFFAHYLQAPLKFMDDPSSEPRLRRRGMPGSHTLSDTLGETVLFCLDFAVNQATGGQIYTVSVTTSGSGTRIMILY
ncbi:hypothetical protein G6011_09977 [Alternaria panax]|uniref:Uncharacterized protein n=1 Tax=Alternaria panax TaxID=48097 RepID=A0AAD4I8J4_9PLEO|nr:hypothetical protein G6011_09977 [Alternaria panax]